MIKKNAQENNFAFIFLIIPAILLILGYYINPYPPIDNLKILLQIPMFLGLVILGIGFFITFFEKNKNLGSIFKISGWIIFAFYWATQPAHLYYSEGGDIFNGVVCILGVFVLFYIAYHEWLSVVRNEHISCLNWLAGASFFAGIIYFGIERLIVPSFFGLPEINLANSLISIVSDHSTLVLNTIIGNAERVVSQGPHYQIYIDGHYAVTIIFACTAIQAMVIFIGMLFAIKKVDLKRRIIGLAITVIPIYILNLFRNAMVAFLVGRNITDFNIAHNILSKIGALMSLIILLLLLIKIVPEILDEIFCFIDLYKRNGPIEKTISKIWGKK